MALLKSSFDIFHIRGHATIEKIVNILQKIRFSPQERHLLKNTFGSKNPVNIGSVEFLKGNMLF